jgi:hypothetical protein
MLLLQGQLWAYVLITKYEINNFSTDIAICSFIIPKKHI